MAGATVTKLPHKDDEPEKVLMTPEMATELLDRNKLNRPLKDHHVQRIARAIKAGRWRYNGDTIKIAINDDVLDGQHRLWAIIEAKKPVKTLIVRGIEPDAFSTIDTGRVLRSAADTVALSGTTRHREVISAALKWLVRWQRGTLERYKAPQNLVENYDIEEAYKAHPDITRAVDRAMALRRLTTPSLMAFVYYVAASRDAPLAERMMDTLIDPGAVAVADPFFRLRCYFTADHHKRKEALMTIALAFKAINAAAEGSKIQLLSWKNQGKSAEPFPTLLIKTRAKP